MLSCGRHRDYTEDGRDIPLGDKSVWDLFSPNPPYVHYIKDVGAVIRTDIIKDTCYKNFFKYVGIDIFVAYGNYTGSPYIPYETVAVHGFPNSLADLRYDTSGTQNGQPCTFTIHFRDWKDKFGGALIKNETDTAYVKNPSGIDGVQAGANMSYNDLYKIAMAGGCVYIRAWYRTRYASEHEQKTPNGYIYSGWINFPENTQGHTFDNGVCYYMDRPFTECTYKKSNDTVSAKLQIPYSMRIHRNRGYDALPPYHTPPGTVWDIAVTVSAVGDPNTHPAPGVEGYYGKGEVEVFRGTFTKESNDWKQYNFNFNVAEKLGDSMRGRNVALRTWYRVHYGGEGNYTPWETFGPTPTNQFHDYSIVTRQCFPKFYYNRFCQPSINIVSTDIRNNALANNVTFQCRFSDPDSGDKLHAYKSFGKFTNTSDSPQVSIYQGSSLPYDKYFSMDNFINSLGIAHNQRFNYYKWKFKGVCSGTESFDKGGGNGLGYGSEKWELNTSNYFLDFVPSVNSINLSKHIGVTFTMRIDLNHPEPNKCRVVVVMRDTETHTERYIIPNTRWGNSWQERLNGHWSLTKDVSVNMDSIYGSSFKGRNFEFTVGAISPYGWDMVDAWKYSGFKYNDKPNVQLEVDSSPTSKINYNISASDPEGIKTYSIEIAPCKLNDVNSPDMAYKRIFENVAKSNSLDIARHLTNIGLNPDLYVNKKIYIRAGADDGIEGGKRATDEYAFKTVTYDKIPNISISIDSEKGEYANVRFSKDYPEHVRYKLTVKCDTDSSEKVLVNFTDATSFTFYPRDNGYDESYRGKTFRFKLIAITNNNIYSNETSILFTYNEKPRLLNLDIKPGTPDRNGMSMMGNSATNVNISYTASDPDTKKLKIGVQGNNIPYSEMANYNLGQGDITNTVNIDLKTIDKRYLGNDLRGIFNVKDVFNIETSGSTSSTVKYLDGHMIKNITLKKSANSDISGNTVMGLQFKVNIECEDSPFAVYSDSNNYNELSITMYDKNDKNDYREIKKYKITDTTVSKPTYEFEFDARMLSMSQGTTYVFRASIITYKSNSTTGEYIHYSKFSDIEFMYADAPKPPLLIHPLTFSNNRLCLKRPPLIIQIPMQDVFCNNEISNIVIYFDSVSYTSYGNPECFDGYSGNMNGKTFAFYPNHTSISDRSQISFQCQSKLTGLWSTSSSYSIYYKDISLLNRRKGEYVTNYQEPKEYLDEIRALYGLPKYSYLSSNRGEYITYYNAIGTICDSFNDFIDNVKGYISNGSTNDWMGRMNIPYNIHVDTSIYSYMQRYLTSFNKI